MLFRKILPIIAILFIVALALSNYFNKLDEASIRLARDIKCLLML